MIVVDVDPLPPWMGRAVMLISEGPRQGTQAEMSEPEGEPEGFLRLASEFIDKRYIYTYRQV